jgi:4-amino-4-deoxy-L-arabinose transferase-like glycosyltransferase
MRVEATGYKRIWLPLLSLFLIALVFRLLYLWAALDNLGLARFWNWAPDTNAYWTVARQFTTDQLLGDYYLFRVGPGYGLILASLHALFGPVPMPAILLNILLGSIAPVIIFLTALELFGSRPVAWVAGLIGALSHTSIALSCHILTDQPYFTLHAAALLCFILGFKRRRTKWFVIAGSIAGIATLVRPSGQLWPILFLFMAVAIPWLTLKAKRVEMMRKASLTGVIMLAVVLGWSVRNCAAYGEFTFGSNGVYTLQGCVVSDVLARHQGKSIVEYRHEWGPDWGVNPGQHLAAYREAKVRVAEMFKKHPTWVVQQVMRNIDGNIKAKDHYTYNQIPLLKQPMEILDRQMTSWGGWTLAILTLLSIVLLIFQRNHLAWTVLGTAYIYFTIIVGFSIWQGSRLHYTAEMAWSILIAWLAVESCRFIFRRSSRGVPAG